MPAASCSHMITAKTAGDVGEAYSIHVEEVPAAEGAAATGGLRWPVVAVHGLTRNHLDFLPLAARLSRAGAATWCVDVVGRGESGYLQDKRQYCYGTYVAGLERVLERAGAGGPVNWMGTSMGGLIGMMVAAARPEGVRALVINDIGPFVPAASIARLIEYVGKEGTFASLGEVEAHLRRIYSTYGELSAAEWGYLAHSSVHFDQALGRYVRSYDDGIAAVFGVAHDVDVFPVWSQVRCPVLLLHGEASDILSRDTIDRMHRERHPDAPPLEVHTIPDVGHAPSLFKLSQLDTIIDFFSRV